jgi:hypothetical protein
MERGGLVTCRVFLSSPCQHRSNPSPALVLSEKAFEMFARREDTRTKIL